MELNSAGGKSQVVSPRVQYWGQFSLTSSSVIKGIMCIFSKFADVSMSDKCIDRKALQMGLYRLGWWAEADCMTFNKALWWV